MQNNINVTLIEIIIEGHYELIIIESMKSLDQIIFEFF